jgi:hypothetical protein
MPAAVQQRDRDDDLRASATLDHDPGYAAH